MDNRLRLHTHEGTGRGLGGTVVGGVGVAAARSPRGRGGRRLASVVPSLRERTSEGSVARSRRDARHERPQRRARGHAALRLHRPLRAAQAALHLQNAASRARPEGQVRGGRALQEAQSRERGAVYGLPGPTTGREAGSIPQRLSRRTHGNRVRGDGHQHPAGVQPQHQRLQHGRPGPRVRLRQGARQGAPAVTLHHERRVREVARLDRPRASGRRRLPRVRRGEGTVGRLYAARPDRALQPAATRLRGEAEGIPTAPGAARRPRPRAADGRWFGRAPPGVGAVPRRRGRRAAARRRRALPASRPARVPALGGTPAPHTHHANARALTALSLHMSHANSVQSQQITTLCGSFLELH